MKLSLIIPTYNRAAWLEPTLASVLRQTRVPDEVIVVDDGSTDETRALVARLWPDVRYHYQANAGLAAARSAGFRLSSGELLCFLDSDDVLLPRALEELEKALRAAPEAALAYCQSQTINAPGQVVEEFWPREDFDGEVWEHLIDGNFVRSSGCALIRRAPLLAQEPPWDAAMAAIEDWDLWVRLAETAPFVRVRERLFQYRVHAGNRSSDVYRMHTRTFSLLRKHRDRQLHNPARRRYLRAAQERARYAVAGDCQKFAHAAQLAGDDRLAIRYLLRALRLRLGLLLEWRFMLWLLDRSRFLWRTRRSPRSGGTR